MQEYLITRFTIYSSLNVVALYFSENPAADPLIDHPLADNNKAVVPNSAPVPKNHQGSVLQNRTGVSRNPKVKQRGCCLSLSDHDRLRIFIHEFIVRGLIPWAEKTLRQLNEQVLSM